MSRILDEMYETAVGMHEAGIMSDRKFRQFKKLWNARKPKNKFPKKNK